MSRLGIPGRGPSDSPASASGGCRTGLRELYPVAIFYFLYTATAYVYRMSTLPATLAATASKAILFATSPFSLLEALPPLSTSTAAGLSIDFLFVAVVMIAVAAFNLRVASRGAVAPSMPTVFFAAVAATYIVSLQVWLARGVPASGTSIIAFSMLGYLVFATSREVRGSIRENARSQATGWAAELSLVVFTLMFYLVGEASLYHVEGGLLTIAMISVWKLSRSRSTRNPSQ